MMTGTTLFLPIYPTMPHMVCSDDEILRESMAAFCWELPETELWNREALDPSTPLRMTKL
jgi:hypothetical protein